MFIGTERGAAEWQRGELDAWNVVVELENTVHVSLVCCSAVWDSGPSLHTHGIPPALVAHVPSVLPVVIDAICP